jgi:multisubunit Na+/H+ antiporter MnhF subunit
LQVTLDIWLFAAVCLFILAFCAVLRVIPGPTLHDRLIAANIATTLACAGALSLTISAGYLIIPVLAGLLACIVFATTIRISQVQKGKTP